MAPSRLRLAPTDVSCTVPRGGITRWAESEAFVERQRSYTSSQVENLDHPTLSINHNWTNATNIRAVYYALRADDEQTCEALSDVRELMQRQPKWEAEWEACVADVLSRNAGWE